MSERRIPIGEYVKVKYEYHHPLGLRTKSAFIFCDCVDTGNCKVGTKHAGEDTKSGNVVLLLREMDKWVYSNS